MVFIGKTKHFTKWAKQAGLADAVLRNAVKEMEKGLIDADLKIYKDSGRLIEVSYEQENA